MLTDPNANLAMWLYRIYSVTRVIHTMVYAIYPVRQPVRAIIFIIGFLIIIFMAVRSLLYFQFHFEP